MAIKIRFHETILIYVYTYIYIYFNQRGDVIKFQAGKSLRHVLVTNFFNFQLTNF